MWQRGNVALTQIVVENVSSKWKRCDLAMSFICRTFVVHYNGNKAFSVYVAHYYYYQLTFLKTVSFGTHKSNQNEKIHLSRTQPYLQS